MRKVTTDEVAETLLSQLLFMKGQRPGTKTKMRDIFVRKLVSASRDLFVADTSIMKMEPPMVLVGGIFAHFYDLLSLFETYGHPPAHQYVFLGDVIGRGKENIETIVLLLCYKVMFPNSVFIIRGYNELTLAHARNGFRAEVLERYDEKLYDLFVRLFSAFPIGAIVGSKIFCVNCGIPREILLVSHFDRADVEKIEKNNPLYDLFTTIPDHMVEVWSENDTPPPPRFGLVPVRKFLEQNGFELIIRSHDIVEEGYEFPFDGDQCMLTLSTLPSYSDRSEKLGAIVEIDKTLKMTFRPLRPLPAIYRDYYERKKKKPIAVTMRK